MTTDKKKMAAVLAIGIAVLLSTTACSGSDSDTQNSSNTHAASDSATWKTTADKLTKKLSLDVGFPDCTWKASDNKKDGIVYQTSCEADELILATGDKSGVKTWAESMADNEDFNAFVAYGNDYAIVATSKSNMLHARDVLGGNATVIN